MDSKTTVIIGAGPIGIDMALTLLRAKDSNMDVVVIEKGPDVGAHILEHWAHVTLFSPHTLNASQTGLEVLSDMKCEPLGPLDPERFSTGEEFVDHYLKPVSSFLRQSPKCKLMFNTTVVAAARKNLSKGHLPRAPGKFELLVEAAGSEDYLECDYLVDCSGTISTPNFMGKAGMPAAGERQLRAQGKINYHIPAVLESEQGALPDKKHVVVIGAGTSAITSIAKCLNNPFQEHQITWVTRTPVDQTLYDRVDNDPLPQRDALFVRGNALAEGLEAAVTHRGCSDVLRVEELPDGEGFKYRVILQRRAADGEAPTPAEAVDCHEIVANTGYRPDTAMLNELQVHYCFASEGPMKLAAALLSASGGSSGNCLEQVVPGRDTLRSPEPRLFIIGIKSYGRGNAFLLRIGYEQVQHVAQLIAEDA